MNYIFRILVGYPVYHGNNNNNNKNNNNVAIPNTFKIRWQRCSKALRPNPTRSIINNTRPYYYIFCGKNNNIMLILSS